MIKKIKLPICFLLSSLFLLVACESDQRLEQSRLDDFARFGRSVDISFFTAVIGAYQESNGTAEGAAYVYQRRDDVWSIQARLESPSPGDEEFGSAVAVSGTLIAVGAPLDHVFGTVRSGSVYLYERDSDNNWNHIQTLNSPILRQPWEAFGHALALDGDVLVVGALDRDQGAAATDAGAVFVYERNGGLFTLTHSLAAPLPATSDKFGSSVDVVGDTIAVGALRRDTSGATDNGAVFIFERGLGGFVVTQTLEASDAADDDIFGTGVALFENNDGSRRLVVGAESADIGANTNAGAAYVFDAPVAGVFSESAKLTASDAAVNDLFGTDVALWNNTILVGASGVDGAELREGAAYVYQLDAGSWVEEAKLTLANTDPDAFMGMAVDIWGEQHALLGAPGTELGSSLTDTGAVQAFRRDTSGAWFPSHALSAAGFYSFDVYGRSIAMTDNYLISSGVERADIYRLDEDAYSLEQPLLEQANSQLFSAAVDENAGGVTAAIFGKRFDIALPVGYVEVFTRQNDEWVQEQLIDPDLVSFAFPNESANSGVITIQDDTLIVGARRWNGGDGRVFVYERSSGVWTQQQLFTSPQAASNFDMNYGNSVALDGNWLAVAEVPSSGLPGSPRNGNVFLYERVNGSFVEQQVLSEAVPSALDKYGQEIALHGELLAVYSQNAGMVYIYRRAGGVYTQVWSFAAPGSVGALALTNDLLAIGITTATVDGELNVGEVLTFERQPDDTYAAGETYQAPDTIAGLSLGDTIAMNEVRMAVSTASSAVGRRVYIFNF